MPTYFLCSPFSPSIPYICIATVNYLGVSLLCEKQISCLFFYPINPLKRDIYSLISGSHALFCNSITFFPYDLTTVHFYKDVEFCSLKHVFIYECFSVYIYKYIFIFLWVIMGVILPSPWVGKGKWLRLAYGLSEFFVKNLTLLFYSLILLHNQWPQSCFYSLLTWVCLEH